MVAISGTSGGQHWELAPCLRVLINETDRLFPGRSIASDGSIGDAAHAARDSDHNPDEDRLVEALDITDDDAAGCDISVLFDHLVATKDKRVKYLIHKGWVIKSYAKNGVKAWTWIIYTGLNSHKLHGHISVLDSMVHSQLPWWPGQTTPTPTPIPVPQRKKAATMWFGKQTQTTSVYCFDGGCYFHVRSKNDLKEIAKSGGVDPYVAVIGANTMAGAKAAHKKV